MIITSNAPGPPSAPTRLGRPHPSLRVLAAACALISLGCHAGQGDHFFPPLPADRIGPALWSSTVRAAAAYDGADVIPLSQRRPRD